ncbi:MAG: 7-cyano-7-deazaguanine synthase QueC [Acidobacteriota bacterium]|nr:7-cyano-7-deazaguanine synthase QueC [Acidobacteriota bacterium]MDH3786067.1 7-cyano-7-deazaguanine synthase QueC [Acidobacteriota bacterium]
MARAVVLLSGGLDSATCLAWAIREGWEAHALSVRYGQRHAVELERAAELADGIGAASHRIADVDLGFIGGSALTDLTLDVPDGRGVDGGDEIPITYVPARNTILLSLALGWAETLEAEAIVVGVNRIDYSGYPDCRPAFIAAFERLAGLATRAGVEGCPVRVLTPLLDHGKGEIVRLALQLGVDLSRTLSCYDPSPQGSPCRRCEACVLRARGFADAGETDPSA